MLKCCIYVYGGEGEECGEVVGWESVENATGKIESLRNMAGARALSNPHKWCWQNRNNVSVAILLLSGGRI